MVTNDANVIPYHKSNRRNGNASTQSPKATPARKQAAGRKAFQGEYCEIHGGIPDETGDEKGCSKFSHLDTSGLGQWKSPLYRRFLVACTKRLKPLFIVSFAAFSFWLFFHYVGSALHIGGPVHKPAVGGVPGSVRHTPPNSLPSSGAGSPNVTPSGHSRPTATQSVKPR